MRGIFDSVSIEVRGTLALGLLLTAASCTRINPGYSDEADTGASTGANAGTTSNASAGRTGSTGPASTTASLDTTTSEATSSPADTGTTTGEPTGTSSSSAGGETGPDPACLQPGRACDPFAPAAACLGDEECRPWGGSDALEGVSCIEQSTRGALLQLEAPCAHLCEEGSGTDRCGPGNICDPFDDAPSCVALCTGAPDSPICGGGQTCILSEAGDDIFGLCRRCSPLEQDCPEGFGCIPGEPGGPTCVMAGGVPIGQECSFVGDCMAGSVCASADLAQCDAMASNCCAALCELGAGGCGPPLQCQPYAAGIGACVPL